jgi:intracellular sulfur oxidation DsrE/DsrF family protein
MVLPALILALGLSTALAGAPRGHNLYQAIADAQAQRTPLDSPRYRILATGEEVRRLMAVGAAPDGNELLARARRSGGAVFVCGKDLKARGLRPGDLLPGVVAVRGYLPYDPSKVEDWERRLPRAPDAKSLAVCAAD